jgi:CelD/BcsL family acetyltransferase involved in cellulose biosynthesis
MVSALTQRNATVDEIHLMNDPQSTVTSGTRVEWITDPARLDQLAEPWDRLASRAPTPFGLHAWFSSWWSAFGAGAELQVCALWRGDELAAALPLCVRDGQLEVLANDHTPVFEPPAQDAEALAAVTEAALDGRPGALIVEALAEGEEAVSAIERAAGNRGRRALVEEQQVSPIVDTSVSEEEFRAASKPRWGAPLDRFRRKMQREHAAELRLLEPPRDLDAELRDGFKVEASGWKGSSGTAILSSDETVNFYTSLARGMATRDALALSGLYYDGQLVAFDYSLLYGNRLWLLKTGFDEEHRRLAPGLVMRLAIIEHCIEQGLEAHELLGAAEEWKLKFSSTERRQSILRIYPRGPRGSIPYSYRRHVRPRLRTAYRALRRGDSD